MSSREVLRAWQGHFQKVQQERLKAAQGYRGCTHQWEDATTPANEDVFRNLRILPMVRCRLCGSMRVAEGTE